jgi:hypothetical protein
MLQDVDKVLQFLESKNAIASFMTELIDAGQLDQDDPNRVPHCSLSTHKSPYELKLYSLGITSILFKSVSASNNLKLVL